MKFAKVNYTMVFIAGLFGFVNFAVSETCTEDQAYNKMMALGRASSRLRATGNHDINSPAIKISMESAPLSQLIADKKFDEACNGYEQIAAKYGIDLKKEAEGLVTMEELRKDGGKRGGLCSQADAHKKMMELHQEIQDKVALGDLDQAMFSQFNTDTAKFGELMYTNPSEVCVQLDTLKTKYKIQ